MDWETSVSKAVAGGKTGSQFAIPDGKYVGDLFFITDAKNKILIGFAWTGDRWIHEHETVDIEIADRKTDAPSPLGLKTVSIPMRIK